MLKAGIIGYGTLGKSISELIESGQSGKVTLQAILVRTPLGPLDPSSSHCTVTTNEDVFFNQDLD
ncbi:MAG: transcriptional regulator, partial [Bacillus sp. (in: firmicutes)]